MKIIFKRKKTEGKELERVENERKGILNENIEKNENKRKCKRIGRVENEMKGLLK